MLWEGKEKMNIYQGNDIIKFCNIFSALRGHPAFSHDNHPSTKQITVVSRDDLQYEVIDGPNKSDLRVVCGKTGKKCPVQSFSCASNFDSDLWVTRTILRLGKNNKTYNIAFESKIESMTSPATFCVKCASDSIDEDVLKLLESTASTC